MKREEILDITIQRLEHFKKTVIESQTTEKELEIELGDSFLYFFKVFENSRSLKIFKENDDFLKGIQQVWNSFKHNQSVILIEHHNAARAGVSLVGGPDVIDGSTTWRQEIRQSGRKPNGKLTLAFIKHVQSLTVSETLDKLINITRVAIKELENIGK